MWRDHTFRKKTRLQGKQGAGGWAKCENGGEVSSKGGLDKIGG